MMVGLQGRAPRVGKPASVWALMLVVAATAATTVATSGTAAAASGAELGRWSAPLQAALSSSGRMPEGFKVKVLGATAPDSALLSGANPRVTLGRKGWAGRVLTLRATSGPARHRRSGWIRFKIRVTAPVKVARTVVSRGQRLSAHHYKVATREVRPHDGAFGPSASLTGRLTRRKVAKGQVIVDRWLTPLGGVRRGDTLDATWVRGGLVLRFSVKALQGGRMGQTINAKVLTTGKTVRAAITGPGRLEVR